MLTPAFLPYFPPFVFHVPTPFGDLRLDSWLMLVVLGIIVGTEASRARAIKQGLSVKLTVDTTLAMVGSGFLFAHFVHVLVYNFDKFVENPTWILPWYGGYSSTGGFIGAAIAIPLFLKVLKKAPIWAYTDNLAIGFILGWTFGRSGCATAHDHLGRLTDFFLAIDFPNGARHDLGLYEALGSGAIFLFFLISDRKERFHGYFSAWLLMLYGPMRFGLDFLRGTDLEDLNRRSDIRYLGLTPAQYGALVLFAAGLAMWLHRRRKGRMDLSGEEARDFGRREAEPTT